MSVKINRPATGNLVKYGISAMYSYYVKFCDIDEKFAH